MHSIFMMVVVSMGRGTDGTGKGTRRDFNPSEANRIKCVHLFLLAKWAQGVCCILHCFRTTNFGSKLEQGMGHEQALLSEGAHPQLCHHGASTQLRSSGLSSRAVCAAWLQAGTWASWSPESTTILGSVILILIGGTTSLDTHHCHINIFWPYTTEKESSSW